MHQYTPNYIPYTPIHTHTHTTTNTYAHTHTHTYNHINTQTLYMHQYTPNYIKALTQQNCNEDGSTKIVKLKL
jgi:hypothetical protein